MTYFLIVHHTFEHLIMRIYAKQEGRFFSNRPDVGRQVASRFHPSEAMATSLRYASESLRRSTAGSASICLL